MRLRSYIVLMCLALTIQGYAQEEINTKLLAYKNGIFYKVGSITPFTGKAISYGDGNKIVSEINYVEGKREGISKKYYADGVLEEEGIYKQKKKEGTFKYYYPTGKLKSVEDFVNGDREGIVKNYYSSGCLEGEWQYKKDQKDGPAILYYANGQLKVQMDYKEGRESSYDKVYNGAGVLIMEIIKSKDNHFIAKYYQENGLPSKEESYKRISEKEAESKNLRDGVFKWYYDSGQLKEETTYRDDKRNGRHTTYYENGGIEGSEVYKNDVIVGVSDYYTPFGGRMLSISHAPNIASIYNMSSGAIIEQLSFEKEDVRDLFVNPMDMEIKDGSFYGVGKFYAYGDSKQRKLLNGKYKMTYPNLEVAFDYEFIDGRPVAGTFIWYRDTGKKYAEVKYIKGGIKTEVKLYYVDGTLQASFNTKDDNYEGRYLTYSPQGVLISDMPYYYGTITGKAFMYYNDGKLMAEENYVKGEKQGAYKMFYPNGKIVMEGEYDQEGNNIPLFYYTQTGEKISPNDAN